MYKFYEIIRDFGDDTMNTISYLREVTLFAPSNEALEEPGVKQMLQDKKRIREILKLHYVKQKLTLDNIKDKSVSQVSLIFFFAFIYTIIKFKTVIQVKIDI